MYARKVATEAERKVKQEKRIQAKNEKQIQIEKNMKAKEAQRITNEKAKIEAVILKHRPNTSQTPDEVDQTGIGSNPNDKDRIDNVPHTYKKATKQSQIKSSKDIAAKSDKAIQDPLLGDPYQRTEKEY